MIAFPSRLFPLRFAPCRVTAGLALVLAAAIAPVAPAAADPLADCDAAYAALDLAASRAAAEAALAGGADAYGAHWRLARVLVDLGNREPDKAAREALYAEAERHARQSVALSPDDTWGHHYLAVAVGRLALSAGGKKKINMSREVRDEAERAIALDPQNDRALHVLARWNREIANLSPLLKLAAKVVYGGVPSGASNEKAIEYFQRAATIAPERMSHRLELAVTHLEMDDHQAAIPLFEAVLAMPVREPNDEDYRAQAEKGLKQARRGAAQPKRDVSR